MNLRLMDYRNSQPFGWGTQDHDCLCPYRYFHWISLPYCTALCGWWYQQNYWVSGNTAPCNHDECHFEQCRRYLSLDVGLTAIPSLSCCTDTLSSFPLVCAQFAAIAIMTTSSRMIYAFARYVIMGIWSSKLAIMLILLIVMVVSLRLPSSLAFTPSWMSPWTRYISILVSSLSSGVSSWAHPGKHAHNVLYWILLTSPKRFQCYCLSISGAARHLIWNTNCSELLSRKNDATWALIRPARNRWLDRQPCMTSSPTVSSKLLLTQNFSDLVGVHCPDYYPLSLPPWAACHW